MNTYTLKSLYSHIDPAACVSLYNGSSVEERQDICMKPLYHLHSTEFTSRPMGEEKDVFKVQGHLYPNAG